MKKLLDSVPRVLSSKYHIVMLIGFFLWLIPLGLAFPSIAPDRIQLIVGNYTNVTSDIGACIAAGGTIAVHAKQKHHEKLLERLIHHAAHPQGQEDEGSNGGGVREEEGGPGLLRDGEQAPGTEAT